MHGINNLTSREHIRFSSRFSKDIWRFRIDRNQSFAYSLFNNMLMYCWIFFKHASNFNIFFLNTASNAIITYFQSNYSSVNDGDKKVVLVFCRIFYCASVSGAKFWMLRGQYLINTIRPMNLFSLDWMILIGSTLETCNPKPARNTYISLCVVCILYLIALASSRFAWVKFAINQRNAVVYKYLSWHFNLFQDL